MLATSERTAGEHLVRGIRKWDFVALVLNSIVGAGIFGLPSRAYALAGVHSLLTYVVCAVPIFLIILCFAEVSSRFKDTGGPYLYARATFGPLVGFEIGWLTWIVRLTAFAALCNLFVDYLGYFLPALGSGLGRTVVMTVVVSFLTGANLVGVRLASLVGNIFTVGKLVPLVLLVVVGFFFINPESYSAAPPGYRAFSASVLLLVFAFTGFETAVIPAGEAHDPQRHLPFAMLTGTAIVVVLYISIQAVCIGTLPELASSQRPLADVGGRLFGMAGSAVISLGALISVTGTMNAIMLAAPRLLFAMAEQGQLPPKVSATHRHFHTPHVAILFSAVGMLILAVSGTFASAATLSAIVRLATYAATCAALPMLRRKNGHKQAPFAVPAGGTVSAVALILIAWLFSSSSWREILQAAVAGAVGLLLYALLAARRHWASYEVALEQRGNRATRYLDHAALVPMVQGRTPMGPRDPHRFVNELDDATVERLIARLESRAKDAVFNSLFDKYVTRLMLPLSARVLEVGCGTGAMLRALARRPDFAGNAIGVDQSPVFIDAAWRFAQAERFSDRLEFHVGDAHKLPFENGGFDAVIAHTLLSHVTEPTAVLKELARVVRRGGSVAIFDGDYASLTYAYPDHEFGRKMDAALAAATFNNPFVLRRLPQWLPQMGLLLRETLPDAVAEIGSGSYFKSFAETYAPFVARAGPVPSADVDAWLAAQLKSIEAGMFFASCNYYAFLATRE